MTVLKSYDFESGLATGTNMTTANNTMFTNLVSPAGTWTFSSAHLLATGGGSLTGRVATSASTAIANGVPGGWTTAPIFYSRFYLYVETLPAAAVPILQWRNGATTTGDVNLVNTGAIRVRHSGLVAVATSGTLATAGTWVRIETMYNSTAGTYQLKVFAGTNVHGSTPDYDSGALAGTTAGSVDGIQMGSITSSTMAIHFDNIVFDNAVFPGSAVAAGGNMKVWTGAAFVSKPVKVWTGSAWKVGVTKVWTGSAWKTTP